MNSRLHRPSRDFAVAAATLAAALFAAAVVLLWSWNAFISEVFRLGTLEFRQALAAVLLIGVVGGVAAAARRLAIGAAGRRHREQRP